MKPKIKVNWEPFDLYFIKKNFLVMTWKQLLSAVNEIRADPVELSALRHQVHRMRLSKGIQIRWSKEDEQYLIDNYRTKGNIELARILTNRKKTFRIIDGKKNIPEIHQKKCRKET